MKKKRLGLYFGSFNPIHIGHLLIASYVREELQLDEIRLIISPQNPFKKKTGLLDHQTRLTLVEKAVDSSPFLVASDVEFELPLPSYTIDTIRHLQKTEAHSKFTLLIGGDNLAKLDQWKEYEEILERVETIAVYNRPGAKIPTELHEKIQLLHAPLIEVSSTVIRNRIAEGKEYQYWLHKDVYHHIKNKGLYSKTKN